ncbi:MAG: (Fe-S)-binding protein [Desulfobacterales bacterium]|nr:(Fe-S)-binding protein [Desulfobacterales bacterium]
MEIPERATLFIQCLVDGLYPWVAEDMVNVFEKLGLEISCPVDQTCCGQPAFTSGYRREARTAARHFIEVFEGEEGPAVCPSGSCVHMVRHHYPLLFQDDPQWLARAKNVGKRTYEFTEFLVDVLGVEETGARFHGKATYHDSCHLSRGLGVREQPRKLIRSVKGVELVEMEDSDRCCGFGGAFSVKYADISTAMVKDKVDNIIASGADVVVGCDMGCLMNIQGVLNRAASPIKVMHIAQLLAAGDG